MSVRSRNSSRGRTTGRRSWALAVSLALLALACTDATAQEATPAAPAPAPWSLGASAYAYFIPDEDDYIQPTLRADRDRLHLEARYNYEDLHTASMWIGWNLRAGNSVALEFTPIAGVVFGNTRGFAPGYEGSLGWRALELYSESEYVFDLDEDADSYFYSWSQLTVAPVEWVELGLVVQRTRAYESERELQRGLLLGVSHGGGSLSAIVFNPDEDRPLVVVAAALEF